ncbi:MAG: hypothetical protein AAGF77_01215 [Bacteroidota bacterium]
MIFPKTNIQRKLSNLRGKTGQEEQLLEAVYDILENTVTNDAVVRERIAQGKSAKGNAFVFDELETQNIYHVSQIRKICTDYRLRFLDSRYFKGVIPQEAFQKISALEEKHQTTLQGYKIMAPSKLFKLEDKDDPLLFAPIGNGYYYLIHTWGNDLHPLRKILVWPFKSVVNLGLVTLLISFIATLLVPTGLFSKTNTTAEFWMVFFFMFKSIAAIIIFYGFALGKNFNPVIWNSKYFNA